MCGINAIITTSPSKNYSIDIQKMHESIIHRGPDGEGYFSYNHESNFFCTGKDTLSKGVAHVYMAHRRLSIIDISDSSSQPMQEDNYSIIFNGEIYNYIEIRDELIKLGYIFKTKGDTEILLRAYQAWGDKCLSYFVGMFSFIILDLKRNTIFVARDPFGIKPLYYLFHDGALYFSSEINALLQVSCYKKTPNLKNVWSYLNTGMTDYDDGTFYHEIKKFPQAHFCNIDIKNITLSFKKYWEPCEKTSKYSYHEATEHLAKLIQSSVAMHMRSDVEFATALSGGIDSSAITLIAASLNQAGDNKLNALGYCATNSSINEEKWIEEAVKNSNAKLTKVYESFGPHFNKEIYSLISLQDEPFASTSIYAQYKLYESAKKNNLKVVLNGQGADEIFGGYNAYLTRILISSIKQGDVRNLCEIVYSIFKRQDTSLLRALSKILIYLLPQDWAISLINLVHHDNSWLKSKFFSSHIKFEKNPYSLKFNASLKDDLIQSLQRDALPALLRYDDRNSMFHSVESRVPFLVTEIADFAYSLPDNFLIDNKGRTKAILRDSMKRFLPTSIFNRTDKVSFSTPEEDFMKRLLPDAYELIQKKETKSIPFFDHKNMEKHIKKWVINKQSRVFWRWFNFTNWAILNNVQFEE